VRITVKIISLSISENDLHLPEIKLGPPDSQLNALPIEITGQLDNNCDSWFKF
jgi:hypothetical protein